MKIFGHLDDDTQRFDMQGIFGGVSQSKTFFVA